MCGLVGVLAKGTNGLLTEQCDAFDTLLFLDSLRGEDSTGVFMVTNRGEVSLAKEGSHAAIYRNAPEYEKLLRQAWREGACLIGHNRKATRGVINDENAHPFVVEDRIVLVHNGGIKGDHKKFADVEVDSHAIAHNLHKHDGDAQKAIGEIDAAYALIWYDFKKGTLNFLRNNERPLWFMETDNAYLWCSEYEMLDFAASRHKLKVKELPTMLAADTLLTYTLNNGSYPMWKLSHQKLDFSKKVEVKNNTFFDRGDGAIIGDDSEYFPPDPSRRAAAMAEWEEWYANNKEEMKRLQQEPNPQDAFDDVPFEVESNDNKVRRERIANALEAAEKSHPLARAGDRETVVQEIKKTIIAPPTKINHTALQQHLGLRDIRNKGGSTTQESEAKMFELTGRGIEYQLFRQIYQPSYPYGTKAFAQPFHWTYANGRNKAGGYYMYAGVVNDKDAVFRHFWEERFMDEDRLSLICRAGTDYVYQFTVGLKRFIAFDYPGWDGKTAIAAGSMGGILVISDRAQLMWGGGAGDVQYKLENLEVKVAQGQIVH